MYSCKRFLLRVCFRFGRFIYLLTCMCRSSNISYTKEVRIIDANEAAASAFEDFILFTDFLNVCCIAIVLIVASANSDRSIVYASDLAFRVCLHSFHTRFTCI